MCLVPTPYTRQWAWCFGSYKFVLSCLQMSQCLLSKNF
nr:MAG TPA: hypothetical protein [Caudoviricetes sp.]